MFMFSILPCSFLYLIQCKHHSPHSELNIYLVKGIQMIKGLRLTPVWIQSGAVLCTRRSSSVISKEVGHDSILTDLLTDVRGQALDLRLCDAGGLVPDVFIAQDLDHVTQNRPQEATMQPRDEFSVCRQQNNGALVDRLCPSSLSDPHLPLRIFWTRRGGQS